MRRSAALAACRPGRWPGAGSCASATPFWSVANGRRVRGEWMPITEWCWRPALRCCGTGASSSAGPRRKAGPLDPAKPVTTRQMQGERAGPSGHSARHTGRRPVRRRWRPGLRRCPGRCARRSRRSAILKGWSAYPTCTGGGILPWPVPFLRFTCHRGPWPEPDRDCLPEAAEYVSRAAVASGCRGHCRMVRRRVQRRFRR